MNVFDIVPTTPVERSISLTAWLKAYVRSSLCNPSRNSFLSGLRLDTARNYGIDTPLRSNLPEVVNMPQRFRENGNFTSSISKIFHVSQWDPRHPEERPGS